MNYITYNKNLKKLARDNRKNSPSPEWKIWHEVLKNKNTGYKFTKQKPIGNYILDFYCSKLLLAVEIDGDSHYEDENYDVKRTKVLNNAGVKVIRYTNLDVMSNLEGVYEDLVEQIKLRGKEIDLK